ncbi:MAG: hypothetical protein EBU26_02785 [Verrucomicrobia bacterium]|nr:hypothetical protein [Verrucomicrobiota bacterium]
MPRLKAGIRGASILMESFLALLFVLASELLICGSGLDRSPRGKVELPAHEAAHLLDAIFQEQKIKKTL